MSIYLVFRWLQPNSYADPKRCEVVCSAKELKQNCPTEITVLLRDQHSQIVHAPNIKVNNGNSVSLSYCLLCTASKEQLCFSESTLVDIAFRFSWIILCRYAVMLALLS